MKKDNALSEINISEEMLGLRLDKALCFVTEIATRNRAQHLIDAGCVFINKKLAKSSYMIKENDLLEVHLPEPESSKLIPLNIKLDILFEDKDILVLNKPAGIVIHPAAGHAQDTLVNALIHHTDELSMKFGENRPGIVHRLDKETSGVLVVAKNDFAHESLMNQFKNRTTRRIYYAACIGKMSKQQGTIESQLARHPTDRKRYASSKNLALGKKAVTHFHVLKTTDSGLSYIRLKLETGRTHQIRVHLSEAGCPIIGDKLYGAEKKIKSIKNSGHIEIAKQFPRFALHASELGFIHPNSGEKHFYRVDWPADLLSLLEQLKLSEKTS